MDFCEKSNLKSFIKQMKDADIPVPEEVYK
jgi:hypothetical protein